MERNESSLREEKEDLERENSRRKCHSKSLSGLTGSQSSHSRFTFQRRWGLWDGCNQPTGEKLILHGNSTPRNNIIPGVYKPSCWWVMDSHSESLVFGSTPCRYFAWKGNKAWNLGFRLCLRPGILRYQWKSVLRSTNIYWTTTTALIPSFSLLVSSDLQNNSEK